MDMLKQCDDNSLVRQNDREIGKRLQMSDCSPPLGKEPT